MAIDLYVSTSSPVCAYVLILAKRLGLELNVHTISIRNKDNLKADFVQMNPQKTVPLLNDNGVILAESRAIGMYLVNKYAPGSSLYPQDAEKRAIVDRLIFFEFASVYASGEKMFKAYTKLRYPSKEEKDDALEGMRTVVEMLRGKRFLAGDSLTLADLGLCTSLEMFFRQDISSGFKDLEQLREYYERVNAGMPEIQDILSKTMDELCDVICRCKRIIEIASSKPEQPQSEVANNDKQRYHNVK
ncbi:glutathione S-transferase 1-1 [Ixodes scapularis]|uniref:glutathione S-transferase 1-1 n=1 Tax=Ixodes scapularis TaxID=6945 RepID=UPI001C38ACF6|nr:glutathione S-transferase 1-1 [Ixodes scapularis]